MSRQAAPVVLLVLLAVNACGSGRVHQSTAVMAPTAASTIPTDAGPSGVYLLFAERQAQLQGELKAAAERLKPLEAEGREEELRRARDEVLESMSFDVLTPFLSLAQRQDLAALPAEQRKMMLAMSLDPIMAPSRVEIRSEAVDSSSATLDVRGYFDQVFTGDPGWVAGVVTLVRETDGWKVAEESWGAPGSGADDAPAGRFDVSGIMDSDGGRYAVTASMWERYGGGWSFALEERSTGWVIRFNNIPHPPAPGEYPLVGRPSIPGDADRATLRFPVSVTLGESSDTGGYDRIWDEDVGGTITIEEITGDRLSGTFEFTARAFAREPVTVRGSFRHVRLPPS
jgi:hypothetical protein